MSTPCRLQPCPVHPCGWKVACWVNVYLVATGWDVTNAELRFLLLRSPYKKTWRRATRVLLIDHANLLLQTRDAQAKMTPARFCKGRLNVNCHIRLLTRRHTVLRSSCLKTIISLLHVGVHQRLHLAPLDHPRSPPCFPGNVLTRCTWAAASPFAAIDVERSWARGTTSCVWP